MSRSKKTATPAMPAAPTSPSEHDLRSRAFFASKCGRPETDWTIVDKPEPERWYDYANADTGDFGQCILDQQGKWLQAPRGPKPVLLAYHPNRGRVPIASG